MQAMRMRLRTGIGSMALLCALCGVPALAWCADEGVDEHGFAAPDVFAQPVDMSPPLYPKDMAWQGRGGVTVLILTIDAAGKVVDQRVERSSSIPALDQAALDIAPTWTFAPARKDDRPIASRARVPVDFKMPPEYALDRVTGRPRDACFARRRSGEADLPVADAEGMLPGFIADDCPVGVASVEEARSMLQRYGFRERDALPELILEYTLRDEEGLSYWNVAQAPGMPSLVVRRRLVGNDAMSWYVGSMLCDGTPTACEATLAQVRDSQAKQPRLPPFPVLPPLKKPL